MNERGTLNEEIRNLIKSQPFQPFELELVTGRVLKVNHHDFVLLPPSPRAAHLYWVNPENLSGEIINTNLIISARLQREDRSRKRRKAG
jgi:hypothetical protein